MAEWLDAHPDLYDLPPDKYGNGGLVALLEERAAGLLGVEAALLFPSGTMAQQVALQVRREQTGSDVVALDRNSHLVRFEDNAVEKLSGLVPAIVTAGTGQITADDVRAFDGRFGSLVLELPLRELGFLLPREAELTALVDAVHERGAYVHVDGARLWESAPHFEMPLEEIIRHFGIDSAYLGLDKALGAPSGALLAGSASFAEAAKPRRHRFGGRLHDGGFVAASALMALEKELPRIPAVRRARACGGRGAVRGRRIGRLPEPSEHAPVPSLGTQRERRPRPGGEEPYRTDRHKALQQRVAGLGDSGTGGQRGDGRGTRPCLEPLGNHRRSRAVHGHRERKVAEGHHPRPSADERAPRGPGGPGQRRASAAPPGRTCARARFRWRNRSSIAADGRSKFAYRVPETVRPACTATRSSGPACFAAVAVLAKSVSAQPDDMPIRDAGVREVCRYGCPSPGGRPQGGARLGRQRHRVPHLGPRPKQRRGRLPRRPTRREGASRDAPPALPAHRHRPRPAR
ncbi:beta-eliminating lyase-related protein [Yinghuangia aomiensis]